MKIEENVGDTWKKKTPKKLKNPNNKNEKLDKQN